MRRRLAWVPLALAVLVLAPPRAGSASGATAPKVHVAGVDPGPPGGPRETAIPRLGRPGSERRPAAPEQTAGRSRRGGPRLPTTILSFDGLSEGLHLSPADPTGALGVSYHLAAVNVRMNFFDRLGMPLFAGPKRLRTLDTQLPVGAEDFDPKVVYDPYRQVFLLAFLAATDTTSFLSLVVIPEGSENDTSAWCVVHMAGDQVTGNGKQFADYPMIGFTEDRVTLTTNQFDYNSAPAIGGFRYVQILSMRKSQLYDCSVPVVKIRVFSRDQTRNPGGSRAFTIVPTISNGGSPKAQWMVSVDFDGATGRVILWRLRVENGILRLAKVEVGKGPMSFPPFGRQCSGSSKLNTRWDTGDLRITNSFWDGDLGRVYAATAVAGQIGGGSLGSVVRWWEIDPAAPLRDSTITRKGIVGAAGRDAAWPSVATDGDGKLWINYARAGIGGTDECLSAYTAVVQPGSTTASSTLIKEGDARYETDPGVDRWGDFTAISRDPTDPTVVATYGAYPIGGGPTTNSWQQIIATLADV